MDFLDTWLENPWTAGAAIVVGLVLMHKSADYLVDSLVSIAKALRISEVFAGVAIAAIGSSLPELFSAIASVGLEHPNIGVGTIVGSAIFNITVIVGLVAVGVGSAGVLRRPFLRDWGAYIITVVVFIFLIWDSALTRFEAIGLVCLYGVYFALLLRGARGSTIETDQSGAKYERVQAFAVFAGALATIGFASHIMVAGTINVAEAIGIDGNILALVIIAAGTSIPDAMVSIAAARRGYADLAVANAVGSNTFDILVGLGAPLASRPSTSIDPTVWPSVPFLLGSLVLTYSVILAGYKVTRRRGYVFLSIYAGYILFVVLQTVYGIGMQPPS
jgi:cation:H+ antiporter